MDMAEAGQHSTDHTMTERREVVVVGGGQAGLAIGYFLAQQDATSRSSKPPHEPAAAWRERWDSLKLFTPARYDALPGPRLPGRPGPLPGPRRGRRLPDRLRPPLRPAGRAGQPASARSAGRTAPTWSSSTTAPTRPTRSSSPPGRSRCRSSRRSPSGSTRTWSSSTAPSTGRRRRSRTGRCSWSAAATPASRSPRSCRARARSTCRSDRARRRCRSASSAATCSGTSTRPG